FTIDALTVLAERDVRAALPAVAALTMQQQGIALPRIAAAAGGTDPDAALAAASAVGDPAARQAYTNRVLAAWADGDASALPARRTFGRATRRARRARGARSGGRARTHRERAAGQRSRPLDTDDRRSLRAPEHRSRDSLGRIAHAALASRVERRRERYRGRRR